MHELPASVLHFRCACDMPLACPAVSWAILVDTRLVTGDEKNVLVARRRLLDLTWKLYEHNKGVFAAAPTEYGIVHAGAGYVKMVLMLDADVITQEVAEHKLGRLATSHKKLGQEWLALRSRFPSAVCLIHFPCVHTVTPPKRARMAPGDTVTGWRTGNIKVFRKARRRGVFFSTTRPCMPSRHCKALVNCTRKISTLFNGMAIGLTRYALEMQIFKRPTKHANMRAALRARFVLCFRPPTSPHFCSTCASCSCSCSRNTCACLIIQVPVQTAPLH